MLFFSLMLLLLYYRFVFPVTVIFTTQQHQAVMYWQVHSNLSWQRGAHIPIVQAKTVCYCLSGNLHVVSVL